MNEIPQDAQEALLDPRKEFGPYTLIRLLGRGGMGEVHLAWERDLKRYVAIKLLKQVDDDEGLKRFQREAQLAAGLTHPNIASIYAAGQMHNRPYIAMQYISGQSAEDINPDVDPKRAAEITLQIAEALNFAHAGGVIHRDVTPRNIIVDHEGKAVLTDFGIARTAHAGGTLTQSGILIGTPAYISPEQTVSRTVDPRSDLYSLGATLYFLLTQSPPFTGDDMMEVLDRVRKEEPMAASRLNPKIPPDLDRILQKAMEKTPGRRYQGGKDFADDLRRYLKGETVLARPSGPLARWLRRGTTRVGMAVILIAGLSLAVGWMMGFSEEPEPRELIEAVTRYVYTGDEGDIEHLISDTSPSPKTHYWAARFYIHRGDESKAAIHLEQAKEYAPSHLLRGRVAYRKSLMLETQQLINQFSFRQSADPVLQSESRRLREEGKVSVQTYVALLKRGQGQAGHARAFSEGVLAFFDRKWTVAQRQFATAADSPFLKDDALMFLAISHSRLGQFTDSQMAIQNAKLQRRDEVQVRRLLSLQAFIGARQEAASPAGKALLAHLKRLLELEPDQNPRDWAPAQFLVSFDRWVQRAREDR